MIIFLLGTLSYLKDDREFSNLEYRTLVQKPQKDLSLIRSGEYFKQYEDYFSDQFIARDEWVKRYTQLQMKVSPTFVNNLYVTDDNYIINRPNPDFPLEELNTSANEINQLGEYLNNKGTKLYQFLFPSKTNVFSSALPSYVPDGREEENKQYYLSKLNDQYVTGINLFEIHI